MTSENENTLEEHTIGNSKITCCTIHIKLNNLKQRKIELEKKLIEKNKLLAKIVKDELDLKKVSKNGQFDGFGRTVNDQQQFGGQGKQPYLDKKQPILNIDPVSYAKPQFPVVKSSCSLSNRQQTTEGLHDQIKHNNTAKVLPGPLSSIDNVDYSMFPSKQIQTNHNYFHNSIKNGNPLKEIEFYDNQNNAQHTGNDLKEQSTSYRMLPINNNDAHMLSNDTLSPESSESLEYYYIQSPNMCNKLVRQENNVYYGANSNQWFAPASTAANNNASSTEGLGGYWLPLENNDRIWCSVDDRFSSLNRKNVQVLNLKCPQNNLQASQSLSLGNFDFITSKYDDMSDAISVSSSVYSESKKPKEKTWSETSLDGPALLDINKPKLVLGQNFSTREKSKLSSQSMSLPNRHNNTQNNHNPNAQQQFIPSHMQTYDDSYLHAVPAPMQSPVFPKSKVLPPPFIQQHPQKLSQNVTPHPHSSTSISDIRIESPKNMHVIQQAKFRPYKEISKPFEMADFYKYSTKFRQKNAATTLSPNKMEPLNCGNSNSSPPLKNSPIQKIYYQPPNPSICEPIVYN